MNASDSGGLPLTETVLYCPLGEDRIGLRRIVFGDGRGPLMLNLHHNESTSVAAARQVLEKTGGILLILENQGERLVRFRHGGTEYRFDPNRMFSRRGLRASLQEHSNGRPGPALQPVTRFAAFVLRQLPRSGKPLIALHNNTEGAFSARSYAPGGEYARDAEACNLNPEIDPDHFFLTTDAALYEALRRHRWNVVLQDNRRVTRDGSLSVHFGRTNRKYVNVEARHGAQEIQRAMLEALIMIAGFE